MSDNDLRLIEKGFPCHQVGAETQREQSVGLQPATHRLHVWWARRPLTPSRASIHGSLLPADTDVDDFLMTLGIRRLVATVGDIGWTIPKALHDLIEDGPQGQALKVTARVHRQLVKEAELRDEANDILDNAEAEDPGLSSDSTAIKWRQSCQRFDPAQVALNTLLPVHEEAADPAFGNARIALESRLGVRTAHDAFGYTRACNTAGCKTPDQVKTILDPTSGGGSIPFEALRLGHKVIANELNPVATTILHATLDYPARFGESLSEPIDRYGQELRARLEKRVEAFFPQGVVDGEELKRLKKALAGHEDLVEDFRNESIVDYLYVRTVTCPHCRGEAPLFNALWLSKAAGDLWAVRPVAENKKVRFEPYRIEGSLSKEDRAALDAGTCTRGTGQCIHCRQAIDGDEIKAQARGESALGRWYDVLFAVATTRQEPKFKANGTLDTYASGPNKGQVKTKKVRFFRPPNKIDTDAVCAAADKVGELSPSWEREGLLPNSTIDKISNYDRGHRMYGMNTWAELFSPRQLLCHMVLTEELVRITHEITDELGHDRAKAIVTYLQFAIDKGLDYNSTLTRWEYTRGVVKGTFSRHNYSIKWTWGEMAYAGDESGFSWALSQITDCYDELCVATEGVTKMGDGDLQLTINNGSATAMNAIADQSVDVIAMDPPYYDNVMYAELADYFYVWQKRTLSDFYPGLYTRSLTNKALEAVANPARDEGSVGAQDAYESRMMEIFSECRRVLKPGGVFTIMFTHKSQNAWDTLSRSLIEAGWKITSTTPVESEGANSSHQRDVAAAASSIFLTCRKRETTNGPPATWTGIGGQGVAPKIRTGVAEGLKEFANLRLNPVDEMVASYGRALKVLSEHWPVLDENNEPVSPVRAMNEASSVVAHHHIAKVTQGRLSVDDLSPEAAMAVTMFGIYRCGHFPYHEGLNLSRSLGIDLDSRPGAYKADDRFIGIAQEAGGRGRRARGTDEGYHAPLLRDGSKLRLAFPEERNPKRIENPQTEWDVLHGLILAYAEGEAPQARAYLAKHAEINPHRIVDLLQVYAAEIGDRDREKTAKAMLFDLKS